MNNQGSQPDSTEIGNHVPLWCWTGCIVQRKRLSPLRGNSRYVADIDLPRQLYGYMFRSPHAHAELRRIDTAAARAAPGVHGVYTADDLKRDGIGDLTCLARAASRDGADMVAPSPPGAGAMLQSTSTHAPSMEDTTATLRTPVVVNRVPPS